MKKKGLTFKQHQEAGLAMKRIYEALVRLVTVYANAFPKDKRSPYLPLCKTRDSIMVAQNKGEELLFKDHPEEAEICIYYGPLAEEDKIFKP